jgi:predicted nuclease of restriction endonuclease-like (RecB) superfamily
MTNKRPSSPPRAGERTEVESKSDLYTRIRTILESARTTIARSVDSTHVIANWLVGREIVEEEQQGRKRGIYGQREMAKLSKKLTAGYGVGYSVQNLRYIRQFYQEYPDFISNNQIHHALRGELIVPGKYFKIRHAPCGESMELEKSGHGKTMDWIPGKWHPDLSWSHYRALLKVERNNARNFYEIEAIKCNWSARHLERQIDSLLFFRLLKSRDKKGILALANRGQTVEKPIDIIKDPVILDFIDLPEPHQLVETKIEAALISKMKDFLLELGNGFAFVGRQKRLSLEGDHFYPDLVFYHIKLKCYVIIDIKVQKLTHGDLGQMLMYVHYYDREIKTKDENPTIGLILCTDKNDAVVKYVLDYRERRIFASRYQYELPTEEDLRRELRREMSRLSP